MPSETERAKRLSAVAHPIRLAVLTLAESGPVSASEAAYVETAFGRRWLSLAVGLLVVSTATISVGSATPNARP